MWSAQCEEGVGCLFGLGGQDQDSIRAAGGASSLIRNTGGKEVWRCNEVRDLLSDVHVMLIQTACAAYIHLVARVLPMKREKQGQMVGRNHHSGEYIYPYVLKIAHHDDHMTCQHSLKEPSL
eukprot:378002-Pelagomonas_calceolata.AAC.1